MLRVKQERETRGEAGEVEQGRPVCEENTSFVKEKRIPKRTTFSEEVLWPPPNAPSKKKEN